MRVLDEGGLPSSGREVNGWVLVPVNVLFSQS